MDVCVCRSPLQKLTAMVDFYTNFLPRNGVHIYRSELVWKQEAYS
jgi:hypothetical protein